MKKRRVGTPLEQSTCIPFLQSKVATVAILIAACLLLYSHTASYPYTELDDTIFIREIESYTRGDSYIRSFTRGVFSEAADTYYRPILLNSFVWDRHWEGGVSKTLHSPDELKDDISQYHWTNIWLHVVSVVLLFLFLQRLFDKPEISFLLAMIFAVHPVLCQAVAWIPGRNDTLLAVFTLGFLLCALEYFRTQGRGYLAVQGLLLLGALFTKETGIIAAPVALVVLLLMKNISWKDRRIWIISASWALAFIIWFGFRSKATVLNQDLTAATFAQSFVERLPLIVQYLGKIILPFNLSVFPWQEDTTMGYGIAALVIIGLGILFTPRRNWRMILGACLWYFIFLIPALIVPKTLNREAFEHRLYLPIIGILILLTETAIFQRVKEKYLLSGGLALCLLLAGFNYSRSHVFSNSFAFWENAMATTPSSAYVRMMLGSRYYRAKIHPRKEEGIKLLQEAYKMDPTQKYVNYYLGSVMMDREDWMKMDEYFQKETAKDPGVLVEIYSGRAHGYIERKMFADAERMMIQWLEITPMDSAANTNLLLLYINDLKQPDKVQTQVKSMTIKGIPVPPELLPAIKPGVSK